MIIVISRGKKAKGLFIGERRQITKDAVTAIFAVARGVNDSSPFALADMLETINSKLRKVIEEEDPKE